MTRMLAMVAAAGLAAGPTFAEDAGGARAEIEGAFGRVPLMFEVFPEAGLAGAWAEFSALQLSDATELDLKTKELIGLAVAAQVPCSYCVYFHTRAAAAHGATEGEIGEAVAMAAIVRHWSTVLNGMQVDQAAFRDEVDALLGGDAAATN